LIHDSYGVLPNDVYILNQSFREAFVELFEANPLKDFADQLIYGAGRAVDKIMINTLDLQEVYDSEYIIC
jgi:DNA-directed RNA polymerase